MTLAIPPLDVQEGSVYQIVARRELANPEKTAFESIGIGTFSYRQIMRRADEAAAYLLGLGVGAGDRVVLMANNRVEFVDVFLACGRIGAVFVPLTPGLRGRILADMTQLAEPAVFISEEEWRTRIEEVWNGPTYYLPSASEQASTTWPSAADTLEWPNHPDATSLCLLLFTSGTTGRSKGVMWAHTTVAHMAASLTTINELEADDIMHTVLPLNHGNGLILTVYAALSLGATAAVSRRFSATAFADELAQSRATITNLLGAMCHIVLAQNPSSGHVPTLKKAFVIPVTPDVQAAIEDRFGCVVYSAYGLSDAGLPMLTGPQFPGGSCGRLLEQIWEARLVGPDGADVESGKPGELWVRGKGNRSAAFGYWRMQQETAERYRNGWVATGDLFRERDGWYFFFDRAKDTIRRRGENISSHEVEDAIIAHPAIEQCAVYPVPSEMSEDEVMAAIVLKKDQTLAPLDLIKFLDGKLPYFAIPRYVAVMKSLPMTATNKVLKLKLREIGVTTDVWDREKSGYHVSR